MPVCVKCNRMRPTAELTRRRAHGQWTCKDVPECKSTVTDRKEAAHA